MTFDHLPSPPAPRIYRQCVGIALFNVRGDVFVGERIDTPGAWQMPQGGIDKGESIEAAAYRELKEETGTDQVELIRIAPKTVKYDLPPHLLGIASTDHPKPRLLWGGKYKGQEQHWAAMRFTGHDDDINITAFDPPEFSKWQWVPLADTLNMIVPFKRDVYARVIEMFRDI